MPSAVFASSSTPSAPPVATPSSAVPKIPSGPSVGTGTMPVPSELMLSRVTLPLNWAMNSLPSMIPSKAVPLLS